MVIVGCFSIAVVINIITIQKQITILFISNGGLEQSIRLLPVYATCQGFYLLDGKGRLAKTKEHGEIMKNFVVIVGAGAAGIGMGILLKRLELPFVIIDQKDVGASFSNWCKETRFISPSFTGNAFGSVDLNSVSPDTSPAFSLRSEHPSGKDYARYLKDLASYFELPIKTNVKVEQVLHDQQAKEKFTLVTPQGDIKTNYLIWAAGEFFYPNKSNFTGSKHCLHYAEVQSWKDLEGDNFSIIGAYESGVDAAYQLTKLGKKVVLFDGENQLNKHGSDSSYTLSPFTQERYREVKNQIKVITANVDSVTSKNDEFVIQTQDKTAFTSKTKPIDCTGFTTSLSLVKDLFEFNQENIVLNEYDESTICPNLFLTGPQVKHENAIFCFIYKYRQRFAVVGEELSLRLNGDKQSRIEAIEYYKNNQFYLNDLACCDDDCVC